MAGMMKELPERCGGFDQQQGNPQAMSQCTTWAAVWFKDKRTGNMQGYCPRHARKELSRRLF